MIRVMFGVAALALFAMPAKAWSPPKRQADAKPEACPEVGEGYVRVPNSTTCVKLGGLVRVEGATIGSPR